MDVFGSSNLKVDGKGRVFLIKRFLQYEDDEDPSILRVITQFWLTPGLEGCLWLLDKLEYKRIQRRLRTADIGDETLRRVQRAFFALTERAKPDAQGRVLMSEAQRQLAQIEDRVFVIGVGRRIELWSPARYAAKRGDPENFLADLEAVLSGGRDQF